MARIKTGALGTLVICLLAAAASAWLILRSNGVYCDRLAPVTVLAMLSAFAVALCFRQLATPRTGTPTRSRQLFAALLIAAITLFADVHYVSKYRGFCNQLQQQLHENMPK